MVRIGEWLSEGWALIKDDIVTFAVAMLLAGIIGGVTLFICMPAMTVGLYMMALQKLRGESVAIGDVFKGFEKFGPAFVFALIVGLGSFVIGFVLGLIPILGQILGMLLGFIIGAAVFYSWPLIAARQIGPVEAITVSFEKVKPNFVMYAVTVLVYQLVVMAGAIACGIGTLITGPLAVAAMAVAYRDNFGLPGTAAAPAAAPAAPPAAPAAPPAPEPPAPTPEPPAPTPEPPATEPKSPDEPPTPAQ